MPATTQTLPDSLAEVAGRVRFLGDTTRLRILQALEPDDANVTELCERLGTPRPVMSHQLALLRLQGLISSRRQGKFNFYDLTRGGRAALKAVAQIASISRAAD